MLRVQGVACNAGSAWAAGGTYAAGRAPSCVGSCCCSARVGAAGWSARAAHASRPARLPAPLSTHGPAARLFSPLPARLPGGSCRGGLRPAAGPLPGRPLQPLHHLQRLLPLGPALWVHLPRAGAGEPGRQDPGMGPGMEGGRSLLPEASHAPSAWPRTHPRHRRLRARAMRWCIRCGEDLLHAVSVPP